MTSLELIEERIRARIPCRLDPKTASNEAIVRKAAYEDCLVIVREVMMDKAFARATATKKATKVPSKVVRVTKKKRTVTKRTK